MLYVNVLSLGTKLLRGGSCVTEIDSILLGIHWLSHCGKLLCPCIIYDGHMIDSQYKIDSHNKIDSPYKIDSHSICTT